MSRCHPRGNVGPRGRGRDLDSSAALLNPLVVKAAKAAKNRPWKRSLKDQYYMLERVKSRFSSRNACYHLVQNLLSLYVLSKNVRIKIYSTI
jgi:hypothetical protein